MPTVFTRKLSAVPMVMPPATSTAIITTPTALARTAAGASG